MVSHRSGLPKLGRPTGHRLALLRNLVTSLLQHERIKTTHVKAKACQRLADYVINLGKYDNHYNRIQAKSWLYDDSVLQKLFTSIAPRYTNRDGGYTRVIKAEIRRDDAAHMSYIELVQRDNELRHTPTLSNENLRRVQLLQQQNHQYQNKVFQYKFVQAPKLGQTADVTQEDKTSTGKKEDDK